MKGVDAIGPMLEPTTQSTEGGAPAKTKDGKQFDAVLAEAVEAPKGKAAKLPRTGELLKGELPKGELVEDKAGLVTGRSIHSAIQGAQEALDGEDTKVEDTKLEEPKTPQQDQAVLAQVASVVARIVAPPPPQTTVQTPKVEVAKTTQTAAPANTLPAPPPANDVAPPVRSQEFRDALGAFDLIPHNEVHEAQTLRPGASESVTPPAPEIPRGPIGRALQALTGENAPMRAAADKVMTAFRALSQRDQMPTVPAPAPNAASQAPVVQEAAPNPLAGTPFAAPRSTAPEMPTVRPGAMPESNAPKGVQVSLQTAQAPSVQTPDVKAASVQTPYPQEPAAQVPQTTSEPAVQTAAVQTPVTPSAPVQAARGQIQVSAAPAQPNAGVPNVVQPSVPNATLPNAVQPLADQPAPADAQPAAEQQAKPQVPAQQAANAQVTIVPQADNTNAVQPVVVQLEQPAVSEEVAREQPSEKGEPTGDRVHGFARGGWTGPARSAYGGRGHEGGERSSSDRGETARTFKREEERATERVADSAPQFVQEQLQLPEQQLQAPTPTQEARPQNVPQNQPAPAAAPVQELPDIVFQGRPADATAATENASISLHHPDLGPIQLEVHREQGRVEVHAVIESHHAQAVLRANENGIRQGVQQAGMTFNALRVRVRGEEQPSNRPGQERRRRSNQRET